jgi:FkbM family methyltransferase
MKLPLSRTLHNAAKTRIDKTICAIIVAILKWISNLRYVPEKAIVQVNNEKMLVLPKKGAIHRDLFLYKKREPLCTDYLLHSGIINKGDFVLDLGANIGYYVLVESQLVGEGGKIFAIEPVYSNFTLLNKNVELNNLKNVTSFQVAMGDRNENSKIYVSDQANVCAMTKDSVGGNIIGIQDVCLLTVDYFLEKHKQSPPALIRMDVEGYEYEIFKGMPQLLKSCTRILVELHPLILHEHLDEIFQILKENNFRVRFAVFEEKVAEGAPLSFLMKKAGVNLPLIASDISMQELRRLINENPIISPNVVFEKAQDLCNV